MVLPKEKGLEREAASWFTQMYPRTQAPGWPTARPVDIIQVCVLLGWLTSQLCMKLTQCRTAVMSSLLDLCLVLIPQDECKSFQMGHQPFCGRDLFLHLGKTQGQDPVILYMFWKRLCKAAGSR